MSVGTPLEVPCVGCEDAVSSRNTGCSSVALSPHRHGKDTRHTPGRNDTPGLPRGPGRVPTGSREGSSTEVKTPNGQETQSGILSCGPVFLSEKKVPPSRVTLLPLDRSPPEVSGENSPETRKWHQRPSCPRGRSMPSTCLCLRCGVVTVKTLQRGRPPTPVVLASPEP